MGKGSLFLTYSTTMKSIDVLRGLTTQWVIVRWRPNYNRCRKSRVQIRTERTQAGKLAPVLLLPTRTGWLTKPGLGEAYNAASKRRQIDKSTGGRMIKHTGGCHCGRVTFEVIAPAVLKVSECNCSICSKAGYLHLVVPAHRFKLLTGSDNLTSYKL